MRELLEFLVRGLGVALLAIAFVLAPSLAEPLSIMPQPSAATPPVEAAAFPSRAAPAVEPAVVAPYQPLSSYGFQSTSPVLTERALPVYEPRPLQGRKKINVVVFGDSLGDGVWAGLYHLLRKDKRFNVIRRSRVATGFVRQDYFNWNEEVKAAAAEMRIDVAVVVMGTNDRQTIVEGRKRHALFEPQWREIYEARIDTFTASLQETGAHIFWLQLPVMRQARFEGDMVSFNEIFEARAIANNVRFVKTRDLAIDENGAYTAYGDDLRGKKRLLRTEDGIHFTMPGYELIASPMATLIKEAAGEAVPADPQFVRLDDGAREITGSIRRSQTVELREASTQSPAPLPRLEDGSLLRPGRSDDWRWDGDLR